MDATRVHHVRLTQRLATTGVHTNRAGACRYGSQDHTGESFHALHVDTWIGGAGIRSAGLEEITSRTNKNSSCVNEERFSQRVKKLLQGSIQKRFTKKLFPWPLPCFPAAKAKARGAQMEMHCGVDKKRVIMQRAPPARCSEGAPQQQGIPSFPGQNANFSRTSNAVTRGNSVVNC